VAHYLNESYGDRFYVHQQMRELVESGDLGVKSGRGLYEHGA
jgi:3-hydroxyacyl-CoA dehydrogenase